MIRVSSRMTGFSSHRGLHRFMRKPHLFHRMLLMLFNCRCFALLCFRFSSVKSRFFKRICDDGRAAAVVTQIALQVRLRKIWNLKEPNERSSF